MRNNEPNSKVTVNVVLANHSLSAHDAGIRLNSLPPDILNTLGTVIVREPDHSTGPVQVSLDSTKANSDALLSALPQAGLHFSGIQIQEGSESSPPPQFGGSTGEEGHARGSGAGEYLDD